MSETKKETPAQRVERIKREKAPWSIMDDIRRYAQLGFDSIPDEDISVRFRAWGIYTQGDGNGTKGGALPFFMMRVRTPNGLLNSTQVRKIADLSEKYGRNTLDITNRQNFQLHWLRIEDLPTVWDELAEVGWTSMGACGDNTRTITGCPLAGVDSEEWIDASRIADEIDKHLNGNPDYANLPRKFKISIAGCSHWCTYPEINDIGLTPARRNGVTGFHVRVGGGLSTRPHMAIRLDAFVRPEQAKDVVVAIAGIFRDSDELRRNRAKARFKFLFISGEWTPERMREEIEKRIGYALEPAGEEHVPEGGYRDHVGIHRQKQDGLYYAGFSVLTGRASPDLIRSVADLADWFGDGTIRTTAMQNIVVLNVPEAHLDALRTAARERGLHLEGDTFQRGVLSCTGSEFCKLAVTETKRTGISLAGELGRRLPLLQDNLKIHLAGCPNSCGQHWIADVGLQGVQLKTPAGEVEGFDVFLGGGLGKDATFAKRIGVRVPSTQLPDALERLFTEYNSSRQPGENFKSWYARFGPDAAKELLGGAVAASEE